MAVRYGYDDNGDGETTYDDNGMHILVSVTPLSEPET